MKILQNIYNYFLRTPDWYFIAADGDPVLRPAYWNGMIWENRTEVIPDWRINRIHGRVPNPGVDHAV